MIKDKLPTAAERRLLRRVRRTGRMCLHMRCEFRLAWKLEKRGLLFTAYPVPVGMLVSTSRSLIPIEYRKRTRQ
jgi:hypothetical protein